MKNRIHERGTLRCSFFFDGFCDKVRRGDASEAGERAVRGRSLSCERELLTKETYEEQMAKLYTRTVFQIFQREVLMMSARLLVWRGEHVVFSVNVMLLRTRFVL